MKKLITLIVFVFALLVIASCTKHKCPTSTEIPVEERIYYEEGFNYLDNIDMPERYYYDGAGKLVSYTAKGSFFYPGELSFEYYYDNAGKMERIEYYKDGVLSVMAELVYDSYGRVTRSVQTDSSGAIFAVNYYSYNAANLMVQRVEENITPSLSMKVLYGYNTAGKVIQQDFYSTDGTFLAKIVNIYNSDNILIFRDQYDHLGNHQMHFEVSIGENNKRETLYRYEPIATLKFKAKCYYEPGHAELTETEIEFINQTYISTAVY
ncbi:MAG TPA: hypothetical protein PLB12_00205 [Candidatus Goldiibacteriota bacterium]|nr:hypothetical protein [Candidatus Goldiibacteriota bacterium]HRQ42753.1 hypothetical protein [Candidatus Goldiibacteriota bacterium]